MMISDNHQIMTATTDQWMMQFYNQQSPDDDLLHVSATEGLISDINNTVVTTSSSSPSPTSPKAGINGAAGSRPIRRRSRASKRTPTTLLNANTTNFRALVQQFTGCPSSTAMSFEVYKGPITLNFQQGRRQVVHHHHHYNNKSMPTVTTVSSAAAAAPIGNTDFNNEGHHLRQYQQQLADQQQWRLQNNYQQQQQQSGDHDDLFDYNSDLFSKPSMEISDGLIEDQNYSLHNLTAMNNNALFSNNDVIQNNGSYFM